jgi:hypothetical protein
MLYGGGTGSQNDPYKTAVIDTIVAEIQDNPGDDRCVLMLGYEEQMVQMFQVNNLTEKSLLPKKLTLLHSTSTRVYLVGLASKPRSVSMTLLTRNSSRF